MSYHHEMAEVGRRLARLLVIGGDVPPGDLPAALGAHAAVIQLLRTVHTDLSHHAQRHVDPHVGEVQRNPVPVLGRLLRDSATPVDAAPTDVFAAKAETLAGEHYRAVTRAAVLAEHHWRQAMPSSRPTGAQAWTEMADVAAVAEAVAVLRGHIADSLVAAGRHTDALAMRRQAESGLRVAAKWVGLVAAGGPLPEPAALVQHPSDKVLAVRTADALPEAFRRLQHRLTTITDLSPQDVELIATTSIRATVATVRALNSAGDLRTAGFLTRHLEQLDAVIGTTRRLASLMPTDPDTVAQAQQIDSFLRQLKNDGQGLTPIEATNLVQHIPDLTVTLADAALHQARTGRWLHRAPRAFRNGTRWRTLIEGRSEPETLQALLQASHQAKKGRTDLPRPPADSSPRPHAPHVELANPLAAQPAGPRPATPAIIRHRQTRGTHTDLRRRPGR